MNLSNNTIKDRQLAKLDELKKSIEDLEINPKILNKITPKRVHLLRTIRKIREKILSIDSNDYNIRYDLKDLIKNVDRYTQYIEDMHRYPVLFSITTRSKSVNNALQGSYGWLFKLVETRYKQDIDGIQQVSVDLSFSSYYDSDFDMCRSSTTIEDINLDMGTTYTLNDETLLLTIISYAIKSEADNYDIREVMNKQSKLYSEYDEAASILLSELDSIQQLIEAINTDILRVLSLDKNDNTTWPHGDVSLIDSIKTNLDKYKLTPNLIPKLKMLGKSKYCGVDITRLILLDTLRILIE